MVRVTLLSEYPIYHSFRVCIMSVTYVQIAKYRYADEKMSDKAFSKVAARLSEKGLVLCSSSHWSSNPPSVTYGLVPETDTKTKYTMTIDGKPAFTARWESDARSWKEELVKNGFECEYITEKVETTKEVWARPRGSSIYIHDSLGIETDMTNDHLKLVYEDAVSMTPTLDNSLNGVVLTFTTRWETERVAKKAVIESTMVQAPLADLGLIQSIVEDALGVTAPVDIDCNFRCETLATSECTPDIIAMRRQASIDARNAAQEEE